MEVFGTTPDTTYVFEDSFNGLKAGMASGATVIGVATTNSREEDVYKRQELFLVLGVLLLGLFFRLGLRLVLRLAVEVRHGDGLRHDVDVLGGGLDHVRGGGCLLYTSTVSIRSLIKPMRSVYLSPKGTNTLSEPCEPFMLS